MKYLTAITFLIILNVLTVISIYYFGNISRLIEYQNNKLISEILIFNEQLKINEVEYNLHNNIDYLTKLQQVYFDSKKVKLSSNNLISLKNFKNNETINVYQTSSK